jgi:hypothetical protein
MPDPEEMMTVPYQSPASRMMMMMMTTYLNETLREHVCRLYIGKPELSIVMSATPAG